MTVATCQPPLDLARYIRPGDQVVLGQGTAEPGSLIKALIDQRADLGGVAVFLGVGFGATLEPEHADHLSFRALGGFGTNVRFSQAGVLDVIPCHLSAVPQLMRDGEIRVDVVMMKVSPADRYGRHSLGVVADYLPVAMRQARVVLAEVDPAMPHTWGETMIDANGIDFALPAAGGPLEIAPAVPSQADLAIAELIAERIPDGAVLQLGLGKTPPALAAALTRHRDLGIHTALLGDWAVDLIESGVVTNALKRVDRGTTVAGMLVGTRRLYCHADANSELRLRSVRHTHEQSVLARLDRFVAVNSALEVDLTGQVNSEMANGLHVGAVGGAVDFMRGAAAARDGQSVVALPSTAARGTRSRIVMRLDCAQASASRSDVDLVVTEFGVAELRGRGLRERARRLARIAHPNFRERLSREAER